jgi:hypothetical protein
VCLWFLYSNLKIYTFKFPIYQKKLDVKKITFQVLQSQTEYCFAWRHYELEELTLEAQVDVLVTQYREHNELGDSVPVYVGIWFVTPNEEPGLLIQFEPEKPKLTIIQGGKNDNPIN